MAGVQRKRLLEIWVSLFVDCPCLYFYKWKKNYAIVLCTLTNIYNIEFKFISVYYIGHFIRASCDCTFPECLLSNWSTDVKIYNKTHRRFFNQSDRIGGPDALYVICACNSHVLSR